MVHYTLSQRSRVLLRNIMSSTTRLTVWLGIGQCLSQFESSAVSGNDVILLSSGGCLIPVLSHVVAHHVVALGHMHRTHEKLCLVCERWEAVSTCKMDVTLVPECWPKELGQALLLVLLFEQKTLSLNSIYFTVPSRSLVQFRFGGMLCKTSTLGPMQCGYGHMSTIPKMSRRIIFQSYISSKFLRLLGAHIHNETIALSHYELRSHLTRPMYGPPGVVILIDNLNDNFCHLVI